MDASVIEMSKTILNPYLLAVLAQPLFPILDLVGVFVILIGRDRLYAP